MKLISGHFECKKHAYRQTQDGCVVSFVVHPNDISPEFAAAPLGTLFQVGFQQFDPNAKSPPPVEKNEGKERRSWDQLSAREQAVLRCKEPDFRLFLCVGTEHEAAAMIRTWCGVDSRSALDTHEDAAAMWLSMEADYQSWRTEHQYSDNLSRERDMKGAEG